MNRSIPLVFLIAIAAAVAQDVTWGLIGATVALAVANMGAPPAAARRLAPITTVAAGLAIVAYLRSYGSPLG